ncbi:MAG: hypothetical protein ACPGJV_15775 [Bacteriovoracaceae bacterium]
MRVVVLGSSEKALKAAQHFKALGAQVKLLADFNQGLEESEIALVRGRTQRIHRKSFYQDLRERRMRDLFRVVYLPSSSDQQFGEEKLDESLELQRESFIDCDFVLDARFLDKAFMGVDYRPSINEEIIALETGRIFYNLSDLPLNEFQKVAIVGSSEQTAEFLITQTQWLAKKESRLILVDNEDVPFQTVKEQSPEKFTSITQAFEKLENENHLQNEEFRDETFKWREELSKAQRPSEIQKLQDNKPMLPLERFQIFQSSQVISVEKLFDQNELFLTFEREDEVLSVAVEAIVCLRDLKRLPVVNPSEPGYYFLNFEPQRISDIEKDMMQYFSKA